VSSLDVLDPMQQLCGAPNPLQVKIEGVELVEGARTTLTWKLLAFLMELCRSLNAEFRSNGWN